MNDKKKALEDFKKSLDARLERHLDDVQESTKDYPVGQRPCRDGIVR
jgi:hypothetical protein